MVLKNYQKINKIFQNKKDRATGIADHVTLGRLYFPLTGKHHGYSDNVRICQNRDSKCANLFLCILTWEVKETNLVGEDESFQEGAITFLLPTG